MSNRFVGLLIVFLIMVLVSCNRPDQEEQRFTIGFSQCCQDPWREIMEKEMYRELVFQEELDFIIRRANNDSEKQVQDIKELKALGIDLLIVAPNEIQPLTPIVEEVYQSGIPVILIDRKTGSDQYTAFLGADNYEIGQTAARYLANTLQEAGRIIELQLPMDISPAIGRSRGFSDGLEEYDKLELVTTLEVNPLGALDELFPPLLEAYPDANVVYAHTDLIAQTAYSIAEKMG